MKTITNTRKKFHHINRIDKNGNIEYSASYDEEFSAYYAMQLYWCNLTHCNFFCKENLYKATKKISVTKSMKSVMFDLGGYTYILTVKNGTIMEGIGGCPKYEFSIKNNEKG